MRGPVVTCPVCKKLTALFFEPELPPPPPQSKGETGLWVRDRAMEAWKLRLLICRDEGQSMKKATEHLTKLGVAEETIRWWLEHDPTPGS